MIRLIPAHAGKTLVGEAPPENRGAHPRSRGENSAVGSNACVAGGSSPLTRGKLLRHRASCEQAGLIPAHAGKTVFMMVVVATDTAHPRSRGENGVRAMTTIGSLGSSPLTRGKPCVSRAQPYRRRLIPAHAGKTCLSDADGLGGPAHPRSRGENDEEDPAYAVREGSSPLTRGKPSCELRSVGTPGLIPAHAGKTSCGSRSNGGGAAHPRSRGENLNPQPGTVLGCGSSPLTRGKRHRSSPRPASLRLIPAHAGKTRP